MAASPYLLFDAGGTIVFNDPHILAALATQAGLTAEPAAVLREASRLTYRFDCQVRQTRRWRDENLESYLTGLYTALGLPPEAVAAVSRHGVALNKERSLWTWTKPWVEETLRALCAGGWRMSVISNADGRVERQLTELGLRDCFEEVFDSTLLGVAKPAPEIFHHACRTLSLDPSECLYIGDIFFVDVWGANRAGLRAVHLDPYGDYQDWPGLRIADIRGLEPLLRRIEGDLHEQALIMKDFVIQNF